jgi:signal transduction histidine kinase
MLNEIAFREEQAAVAALRVGLRRQVWQASAIAVLLGVAVAGFAIRHAGRLERRILEQLSQDTAQRDELERLSKKLMAAQEDERRRIARELHDRVGQSLSALNINLDIIMKDDTLAPPARQRLEDSLGLVDGTLQSIENVMAELRPPLMDEYGLAAALGWHAEEFSRRTGILVAVSDAAPEAAKNLRLEAALALFRIAQEALNNAAKHSRARNVSIEISRSENQVLLSVRDDGRGFDTAAARRGRWGMTTMRERAEAAGGQLEVQSAPGEGTRVVATVRL